MRPKSIAKDIEQLCSASSNFITRSSFFKDLCKYVFKICDSDGNGSLNATELYAGVLLVHLNLAKYAGPAACFPASRDVVNQLFIASDYDKSGGIDQTEFEAIMIITAASISSRILVYYILVILLVPFLAGQVLVFCDFLRLDDGIVKIDQIWDSIVPYWINWFVDIVPDSIWLAMPGRLINTIFSMLLIPKIFDMIDQTGNEVAKNRGLNIKVD